MNRQDDYGREFLNHFDICIFFCWFVMNSSKYGSLMSSVLIFFFLKKNVNTCGKGGHMQDTLSWIHPGL